MNADELNQLKPGWYLASLKGFNPQWVRIRERESDSVKVLDAIGQDSEKSEELWRYQEWIFLTERQFIKIHQEQVIKDAWDVLADIASNLDEESLERRLGDIARKALAQLGGTR
jgi:hypothetical protein